MATQSFEQLIAGANKIKQNQLPESNTAGLVGEQLIQMVNKQKDEETERMKGITEYNVSVQHPTGGVGSSEKYTFESAIQHVPNNLRRRAIKCAFTGTDGKSYVYEYQGGTYTDKASWLRVDGEEIHSQKQAVEDAKEEALNKINQQKVTPDMLSQETKDLINASGGGTITNNADGTDLASAQVNGASVIRFADRKHEPSKLNGLGRVYLRADIVQGKRVLTQEMMSAENTVYVVRDDFDLNGATINVPNGCTLKFEGGSIRNGSVIFNDTVIAGSQMYVNCKLYGFIIAKNFNDYIVESDSTSFEANNLKFLVDNAARNNTTLVLTKDYHIHIDDFSTGTYGKSLINVNDNKGFCIFCCGGSIFEEINNSDGGQYHYFIKLERCCNVNIIGLKYKCEYSNGQLDSYDKQNVSGPVVVFTQGDCGQCVFDIEGYRVAVIVRSGNFGNTNEKYGTLTPNYVHKGLYNSECTIKAYRVGYSVAVYTGENLRINSTIDKAHRGLYLSGVSDSVIDVHGKDFKTPVMCLLKDSVYYSVDDEEYNTQKFKACYNIKLNLTDTGSTNQYTTMLGIETYGSNQSDSYHFVERASALYFSNIEVRLKRIIIDAEKASKITGVVISRLVKKTGDRVNIRINESDIENSQSHYNANLINASSELNDIYEEDKTSINIEIANIDAKESNIKCNSPFNLHIKNSKFKHVLTEEYEHNNMIKISNSVIESISTLNKVSKCLLWLENSTCSYYNPQHVTIYPPKDVQKISFAKETEINFNTLDYNMYSYYELSGDAVLNLSANYLHNNNASVIFIKNVSENTIYVSLRNATFLNSAISSIMVCAGTAARFYMFNYEGSIKVLFCLDQLIHFPIANSSVMNKVNLYVGASYYAIDHKVEIRWDGKRWLYPDGKCASKRNGSSEERQMLTLTTEDNGLCFFDTTLKKPIWWNGSKWVDSTGAQV